ncbi:MAG: heme exporter protein CcmB [Promethearchaeota archaeon]|jgi:ABC-type transport system involved in cytochrome c biogenesis permease component
MKKEKINLQSKFKLLKAILSKDLRSELRQINDLVSIFLFAVISIFIFSSVYIFSTENQSMELEIYVIENWLVIFFTLIYIMTKLFVKEKETGTLGGLLSSPVSSNIIILSKTLYCLILLSFVEVVLFIFSVILSAPSINNLSFNQLLKFILLGVFLPTIDLSVCGSLVSAFSMYVKNKSFVLPILLFPLILPITTPIISINIKILEGAILANLFYEIIFLIAHTILMISILSLISQTLLYD